TSITFEAPHDEACLKATGTTCSTKCATGEAMTIWTPRTCSTWITGVLPHARASAIKLDGWKGRPDNLISDIASPASVVVRGTMDASNASALSSAGMTTG